MMKIKKSYLQQIINEELFRQLAKEELLKELIGPPKKPPTKIKPKAKPKPDEKSITFAYLLDNKFKEYKFSSSEIKSLMTKSGMENLGTRYGKTQEQIEDMEFFNFANWTVPMTWKVRWDVTPYTVYPQDNSRYVYKNGLSTLKQHIIPSIPELKGLVAERYEEGYTYGSGEVVPGKVVPAKPINVYNPESFLKAIWYENFGGEKYVEKVNDKVIRKYNYYHGFMPLYTEINNISYDFEGETEVISGIFTYYNYIFDNFDKDRQKQARDFIKDQITAESPIKKRDSYQKQQMDIVNREPKKTDPVADLEKFISSQTSEKPEDKKDTEK